MANEIEYAYPTGQNLYAVVMNGSGQVWNGSTFASPAVASWSSYAVTVSELSSTGLYSGSFPAGITAAGIYTVIVYQRAGASPSSTDPSVAFGSLNWNGSGETVFCTVSAYSSGQDPATLLKADSRFSRLLGYVDGKYTYNPGSGVVTFYAQDGVTVLMTATLTKDGSGNITQRTIA